MSRADKTLSIYVVEDDAAVLRSLCALLNAHGHVTIPCASAENFLRVFDPDKRACLLLDVRLPGMSGTQLQAHLNELGISLPTVVVTAHGDVPIAVQSMRAGAIDFIEKPAKAEDILSAVNLAIGMLFNKQPPVLSRKIVSDRLGRLTDRERDVLDHLLLGKLNKEIANELNVSQRTVEGHRSRIREKMHARGIADLIRMLG